MFTALEILTTEDCQQIQYGNFECDRKLRVINFWHKA